MSRKVDNRVQNLTGIPMITRKLAGLEDVESWVIRIKTQKSINKHQVRICKREQFINLV